MVTLGLVDSVTGELVDPADVQLEADAAANERTGFVLEEGLPIDDEGTAITVTANAGGLLLSITPTGASFSIYTKGVKKTLTGADTVTWTDDEGMWYFYYPNGSDTLTSTQVFDITMITGGAVLAAMLYWDAANGEIILDQPFLETHGIQMDGADHAHWHFTVGAQVRGRESFIFGTFNEDVIGVPGDATAAQFSAANGVVADEDIYDTLDAIGATTAVPLLYLSGTEGSPTLRQLTVANFKNATINQLTGGSPATDRLGFNEISGGNWVISDPGDNDFVFVHYFAMLTQTGKQIYGVIGQAEYGTLANAREGVESEIQNIVSVLPFAEMRALGSVIFQTNDLWVNSNYSKVRSTGNSGIYEDFRFDFISGGNTFSTGYDPTAIHTDVTGEIAALAEKSSPVDADVVVIEDSEDSDNKKKVAFSNLGGGDGLAITTMY